MIMNSFNIKGCGTALITPFRNGEVDYEAYARIVDSQIEAGIDFLVPLGTTAETPCLSTAEKVEILKVTKDHSAGKPLLVGVGTNSLTGTLENIRTVSPYGADAYLVVVPYYNKPTQEGLYRYFTAVADAADKPVVLYNVPGRTGVNMEASTTLRLAHHPNIVAIKEASGNKEQNLKILNGRPEGFLVYSGNDDETYAHMLSGGDGIISVASNAQPKCMAEFVHLMLEGKVDEGLQMHCRLQPLFKACFVESNPIPVKAALSQMGLIANECRLPLTPATESTLALMRQVLDKLSMK